MSELSDLVNKAILGLDFDVDEDAGCSCHLSPPCQYCIETNRVEYAKDLLTEVFGGVSTRVEELEDERDTLRAEVERLKTENCLCKCCEDGCEAKIKRLREALKAIDVACRFPRVAHVAMRIVHTALEEVKEPEG